MVHVRYQRHRRQAGGPVAAPTVDGITGAATEGQESLTVTSLAFDTDAGPGQQSAPPFVPTGDGTIVVTHPPTPVPTSSAQETSSLPSQDSNSSTDPPSVDAQSNSSKPISMGTVIASCVGAFVGAVGLILLGLWVYRRYSRSLKIKARSRSKPKPYARRPAGKSGEDKRDEDRWEIQYQTKEQQHVAPIELFKKSTPSTKTGYTPTDEGDSHHETLPSLAQYHPGLARELGSKDRVNAAPFLDVDAGSPISWETDLTRPTLQSVQSSRHSILMPTPTASTADVVFANPQTAQTVNPFERNDKRSRSGSHTGSHDNPFFSAQDYILDHRRSRSNSGSTIPAQRLDKGKGRAIEPDPDPFKDKDAPTPPPIVIQQADAPSTPSVVSSDRALQNLIAALDMSQNSSRVASVQPSIVSATSVYTEAEEDMAEKSPLPPPESSRGKV